MPTPSLPLPRRRALALFATAAVFSASACGGASSSDKPGSSGTLRTLSLPIQGSPPSFDITQINLGQGSYIWGAVYDTLLYNDLRNVVTHVDSVLADLKANPRKYINLEIF